MRINSISGSYYNRSNAVSKRVTDQKGNVSFGCERKYEAAYEIYRERVKLKRAEFEISRLTAKLERVKNKLEANIKEKAEAEEKLKKLEEEYNSFNPSQFDFMEDVAKGKRIWKSHRDDFSGVGLSNWSPSEDRAVAFTPSDGFPCYCP